MRDSIVRAAFHESILKSAHYSADTQVIDELGLKNGEVRADIAVLNGKLIGYEIKTDKDNLNRLPHQINAYNEVFDRIYIITGDKHLSNVLNNIPDWWGIYLIKPTPIGNYQFIAYRQAKKNKCKKTYSLAQLLWKDEAVDILTSMLKYNIKSQVNKSELYDLLSTKFTASKLTKIVLHYLKIRDSWRTSL